MYYYNNYYRKGHDFARKHAALTHACFRRLSRNFAAVPQVVQVDAPASGPQTPDEIIRNARNAGIVSGLGAGVAVEALRSIFPGLFTGVASEIPGAAWQTVKTIFNHGWLPAAAAGIGGWWGARRGQAKANEYYPLPPRWRQGGR